MSLHLEYFGKSVSCRKCPDTGKIVLSVGCAATGFYREVFLTHWRQVYRHQVLICLCSFVWSLVMSLSVCLA